MIRRRLLLLAAAGILLFSPAAATAAPASTAAGDIPIAEEFWGGPPITCLSVTVGYSPAPGTAGDATIVVPGPFRVPCEMQLSEVGTVMENGRVITPEVACVIVVHEEGHLHGLGHSTDPASVMQADPWSTPTAVMAPICVEPVPPEPPAAVAPPPAHHHRHRVFHRGADLPRPR